MRASVVTSTCTVTLFETLTPTVFSIRFKTEPKIEFKAGQFLSLIVPGAGPGGRDLRRAYSIGSHPEAPEMELCVKFVESGPGSGYLRSLSPGATFRCMAPYGDFIYKTSSSKHAVFIATGTGLAPFRSILLSKSYRESPPASSRVLFGVRDQSEILYPQESLSWGVTHWTTCLSRDPSTQGTYSGRVTQRLREATDINWKESEFYLCGSGDMIKEAREVLAAHGVEKSAIHYEKYY